MQPARSIDPLAPDARGFAADWLLIIGRICFASDFLLFGARKLNNPSIIYNLIDALLRPRRDLVLKFFPATLTRQAMIDRVMLAARILIALPFLADVVKKVVHLGSERALFETNGLPGDTVYLVMLLELIGGLMVLLGVRVRIAGVLLLAWTVILGVVIHNPRYNFNIFGADFAAVMMKNFLNRGAATFFKDVTTVGALLMLFVYGAGGLSVARRAGVAEVPLPIRR